MNQLGQFGGGFVAPQGAQASGLQQFGQFGGGFMASQTPVTVGPLAYYPAPSKKKKKAQNPYWPFQGPMRSFEHHAPYGYMGPLPYGM